MANRYWVGGTADWDATAGTKWALTSGGAGGQAVPTSADDVFLDAASGAVTVTVAATGTCLSLDCTGFTGTLAGASGIDVYGSLTLVSGMGFTKTGGFTFYATTTGKTITSAGKTTAGIVLIGDGGGWTLQDNLTLGNANFTHQYGTLDINDKTVSVANWGSNFTNTRTLTMGAGTIQVNNGAVTINATGLTITANTGTWKLAGDNAERDNQFGSTTWYNLWVATTSAGGTVIQGSNTFNDIKIDAGRTVKFTDGTTQTVTTFTAIGTAGNVITLTGSGVAGWTISDAAGTNTVDRCTISYSTATGGATWNATNSTNGGNNSGWNFTAASAKGGITTALLMMTGA